MKNQISALMDGELDDDEARIVFGRIKQDMAARDEWEIYHLIGDSLRQTPVLADGSSAHFADRFAVRFAEKLAAEPTVLAPPRRPAFKRPVIALSAAASLAAVSLVAWTTFQLNQPDAAPPIGTSKMTGSMAQHEVSRYLVAHQEYSANPMGGANSGNSDASPYLNASLERPQNRK